MSSPLDPTSAELARFVFHAFLVVADSDDSLGPREVERFHEIASAPPGDVPKVLRDALGALQEHYSDLWKSYQSGGFAKTPGALATIWSGLQPSLGSEAGRVARALTAMLDEVVRAGSPMLSRLGLAGNAKAKRLMAVREALDAPADAIEGVAPQPAAVPAPQADPGSMGVTDLWPAAAVHPGRTTAWSRGKTRLRCVDVVPETHDVKSFFFVAEPAILFAYEPGQFMTLELPIEGKTVRRSYTISSSPTRPWTVSITVKRVPNGRVSNWLHDNLKAGDEVNVFGPNGDFTCLRTPAARMLMIAAGSGITPIMSMLRWMSDTHSTCDIAFLDFTRSTDDVIFRQELAHIAMRMGSRLKLVIIPGSIRPGQPWHGPTGHISEGMIRQFVPDFADREVFLCGPGPFMDYARDLLAKAGHPPARYHQESFGGAPAAASAPKPAVAAPASAPAVPRPAPAPVAAAPTRSNGNGNGHGAASAGNGAAAKSEIVFAKSGKTVACSADEVILEVAEAHGIAMEHSCRSGTCGTCKTIRKSGDVEMDDQSVLGPDDLAAGYVLACVGRARGRVVLDA